MQDLDEDDVFVYYHAQGKDHFLVDGSTLCHHGRPPGGATKPFTALSERERELLAVSSDTCTRCRAEISEFDLLPDSPDPPSFPCPVCGDTAGRVKEVLGRWWKYHPDGDRHQFDSKLYEQWRRGEGLE